MCCFCRRRRIERYMTEPSMRMRVDEDGKAVVEGE